MNSRCDRQARDRQACDRQARAAGLAAGGPVVGCDREARAVGLAAGGPGLSVLLPAGPGPLLPILPFFHYGRV